VGVYLQENKPLRVGVYLPSELAEKLHELMKELEIDNFSRIVQEALRLYISEHAWRTGGFATGVVVVLYDHEIGHVDEELTDIQHGFLDVISASIHIHLDERNCMLVIVVKGSVDSIKQFVGRLERVRGVKLVRPFLVSSLETTSK
jgi:CopG family nickel-responsive transcriptional regulator